jgi:hypothetical protein
MIINGLGKEGLLFSKTHYFLQTVFSSKVPKE